LLLLLLRKNQSKQNFAVTSFFDAQVFDLPDQRVDFLRRQFTGVLGHVAFAVRDDVAQVVRRSRRGFVRGERWPSEVAALGCFTVTFSAVCLEERTFRQGCVRLRRLGEGSCEP